MRRAQPARGGAQGGAGMTVAQYSALLVDKYLRAHFSPDPRINLDAAGAKLYELLQQLVASGAAPRDSADAKAPLKAVRDAITAHAFSSEQGAEAPQVEALVALFARLEELCEEAMYGGSPSEAAAALEVRGALRYRLSRLAAGEGWDAAPRLKLRVVKLMMAFMQQENDRLLAGGGQGLARAGAGASAAGPSIRLGRASSGRRVQGAAVASRWGEAINELARVQAPRLLPLLKLALLENLSLTAQLEAATGRASTAGSAAPGAGRASAGSDRASDLSAPGAPPLGEGARPPPAVAAAAAGPATPAPAGRRRQPPESPAGERRPEPPSAAWPQAPAPLVAAPAGPTQGQPAAPVQQAQQAQQPQQQAPPPSLDLLLGLTLEEPAPPPAQPEAGQPPAAPHPQPPSPASAAMAEQAFAAFDSLTSGSCPLGVGNPFAVQPQPATAGASAAPHEPSPYLGVSDPFGDRHFADLAPELQAGHAGPAPPAPSPGPPMRSRSDE